MPAKNKTNSIAANPMSGYGGYPVGYGKTVLHEVSVTKKDYWLLAQSIENNVNIVDVDLQSSNLTDEILLYQNLKLEIETTIETFEDKYDKIDAQKKSFILSLIEIPRFRQKIEYLYERFNDFAKHSSKYKELEYEDMKNLSRQVNFARNTIHGQPGGNRGSVFARTRSE